MSTLAASSFAVRRLSSPAERLLAVLRAEPVRWIVLSRAGLSEATGLRAPELVRAVEELEAADLVERAPYGPLLFIR